MKRFSICTTRVFIIIPMLIFGFLLLCPIEAICENQDYFTFGSTISDVVAIQGRPDSVVVVDSGIRKFKIIVGFTYNYGKSRVFFGVDDGRVDGWWNNRNNPLKTPYNKDYLLLPKHFDTDEDFFTLGATEDEVIVIQGKPDYICRRKSMIFGETYTFVYGDIDGDNGSVRFENGRVIGWNMKTIPLKVKLVTKKKTGEKRYFTLGSTMDEVAAVQGTPDNYDERITLVEYGSSKLELQNGRVSGWWNSHSNPLKVKLFPERNTVNKGYFTVGSTKNEVLAVQGTPDVYFADDSFSYGSPESETSKVYFENNHVVGWLSDRLNPLQTKPCSEDCFTIGSTKDEVLAIQGTPDYQSDTAFDYSLSAVYFKNNRVIGWNSSHRKRLKVELLPNQNTDNRGYFTIGSTINEVLTVQGTPDSYRIGTADDSDRGKTFGYDLSEVYFRNGRVTAWDNNLDSPLRVKESPDK